MTRSPIELSAGQLKRHFLTWHIFYRNIFLSFREKCKEVGMARGKEREGGDNNEQVAFVRKYIINHKS